MNILMHIAGFLLFVMVCMFLGIGTLIIIVFLFAREKKPDEAGKRFDADYGDADGF